MRKPVLEDRLRGAQQANGFESSNVLAQEAGIAHTTVSRLLTGRVKTVNKATLERLANTLHVPAEWLSGERSDLPYVPQWKPGRTGEGTSLWERPTADYVLYSWLMQSVEAALRRDLADWYGDKADQAYDSWGRWLTVGLAKLASGVLWRVATLEAARQPSHESLLDCDDSLLIKWLTLLLEPWFRGRAYLQAKYVGKMFDAFADGADVFKDEIVDADVRRAFGEYAKGSSKAITDRLAAEYEPEPDEGRPAHAAIPARRKATRTTSRRAATNRREAVRRDSS